jgi:hypothetical protein
MTYVHTCIYITSALLFFSSLYTSSILLGRLAGSDPSCLTQESMQFWWICENISAYDKIIFCKKNYTEVFLYNKLAFLGLFRISFLMV